MGEHQHLCLAGRMYIKQHVCLEVPEAVAWMARLAYTDTVRPLDLFMMDLLSEKSAVFQSLALVVRVKVQQHCSKCNQCLIVKNVFSLRNRMENVLHCTQHSEKIAAFFPSACQVDLVEFSLPFFKIIILRHLKNHRLQFVYCSPGVYFHNAHFRYLNEC